MSRRRLRAMTLFEVVISIALIGMLLGSLTTFFHRTLTAREEVTREMDRTQLAQQMLLRMADELRGCIAREDLGYELTQFEGDRRSITFVTCPLPPTESYAFFRQSEYAPPPRYDLREVTYELWIDPDDETDEGDPLVAGILRTEQRALLPYETEEDVPEGADLGWLRRDLWAPELGYLEFRYYDGVEWSTSWSVEQGNPLPHLVQITVGFDSLLREELDDQDLDQYPIEDEDYELGPDVPDPDRYSLIVRIPAADEMFTARLYRLSSDVDEVYEFMGTSTESESDEGESEGEDW